MGSGLLEAEGPFEQGGGPVFYVRGDEWQATTAALPTELRTRLVRYWPGASSENGEWLPSPLATQSEWVHEREWRVPHDFGFDWSDVKFLIVPNYDWIREQAHVLDVYMDAAWAEWFESIPVVVIGDDGILVGDRRSRLRQHRQLPVDTGPLRTGR